MFTFLKAQIASLTASMVDYFCTVVGVELLHFHPVWASTVGTVMGGLTNFRMGRRWVFGAKDEKASIQMFRYGVVWLGYLLLTTLAMYLFTHFTHINYIIAKVSVSLFLGFFYNYPLQKKFVFA